MIKIDALPAFSDNYIWLLQDLKQRRCAVVDPGDAAPVEAWLAANPGWQLSDILITHHHFDHVGGIERLKAATGARVMGPANEKIPGRDLALRDGDQAEVLGQRFDIYEVPGHTLGHIAYIQPEQHWLFCGDTLFSAGCGRLFEGTPQQMLASLDRLAALPDDTRVCCTHEYTLSNLRFARAVDPDNADLQAHEQHCQSLRERNLPTLPSSIGLEKQINPFLRVRAPALSEAARRHAPETPSDALGVFTTLRAWKNVFQ